MTPDSTVRTCAACGLYALAEAKPNRVEWYCESHPTARVVRSPITDVVAARFAIRQRRLVEVVVG